MDGDREAERRRHIISHDTPMSDGTRRSKSAVRSKNSNTQILKDLPGDQEVARRPLPRLILLDELETNAGVHLRVFMWIAPRQINIAGITLAPEGEWMKQMA